MNSLESVVRFVSTVNFIYICDAYLFDQIWYNLTIHRAFKPFQFSLVNLLILLSDDQTFLLFELPRRTIHGIVNKNTTYRPITMAWRELTIFLFQQDMSNQVILYSTDSSDQNSNICLSYRDYLHRLCMYMENFSIVFHEIKLSKWLDLIVCLSDHNCLN